MKFVKAHKREKPTSPKLVDANEENCQGGSLHQMANRLAEPLDDDIHLHHPVDHVSYSGAGVEVSSGDKLCGYCWRETAAWHDGLKRQRI